MLTTSSCGSNPDGDGDVVGTQKCRCMMQTCSLAHWRQPYVCALNAEKAALLGCGSTQIFLSHICFIVRAGFSFVRGNTGKHSTTPSETRCQRQCNCQCAVLCRYVCMHLNCVYIFTYPHTHVPARTHTLYPPRG